MRHLPVCGFATGRLARLGGVLGSSSRQCHRVGAGRDGFALEGFAGLPTYSKANTLGLYLFVNGRAVRDKLMLGAVRAAYADHLPRDRHPVVALFVTLDPREVDVNVHPAKAEVRFRDAGLVRAIVRALQDALAAIRAAPPRPAAPRRLRRSAPTRRAGRTGTGAVRRRGPQFRRPRALARRGVSPRRRKPLSMSGRKPPSMSGRKARSTMAGRLPSMPGRQPVSRRPRRRPSMSARRRPMPASSKPIPTSSTVRSGRRAPSCTRPISWRRPATASSLSISMPPMSGWSMSG
jgi:DNA mismatch repair ATPase MutL